MTKKDLSKWVNDAPTIDEKEFRQAIHTFLLALSITNISREIMIMKGGILLALSFESNRFTKDVDFSTDQKLSEIDVDEIINELGECLISAISILDYGLDCRIQSHRIDPGREDATFPTFYISIGYAYIGSSKHKGLQRGESTSIFGVDFSFFEQNVSIEKYEFDGQDIKTYSLVDLVAEKYRAIIQQRIRNRARRQDAYDIFCLIQVGYLNEKELKFGILQSLKIKSESRNIVIHSGLLREEETIKRSRADYESLRGEITGELPDFEMLYDTVAKFYESLPW